MPKETVAQFLDQLDHQRKVEIEAVRALILGADTAITERIKWNAPSFCYGGDDRVTMRLQPGDRLELIFHRGAKVKDSAGFAFSDDSGLLKWLAADRGVVVLAEGEDLNAKQDALKDLVVRWMKATL